MNKLQIPGISILDKYKYQLTINNNIMACIENSGKISHFDKQKLFCLGWKNDLKMNNCFTLDILLCK